jgi:hypothetical protein
MKKIAIYNIKGGVGKTAAAVNLAYLAAEQGARTLLGIWTRKELPVFIFASLPKSKEGASP